jgi:hypothetical protein
MRLLKRLRIFFWPLRSDFTEREFYRLPLSRQRWILGLASGQNPPSPSYLSDPENVILPTRVPHA